METSIFPLFRLLQQNCARLELVAADRYIDRILIDFREGATTDSFYMQCTTVRTIIQNDLAFRRFAYLPMAKATMLDNIAIWKGVWIKFPSVEIDARRAVEAYAVGLNTACVYHTMMVLEVALRTLASRLGVKYDRRVWHRIIEDIEDAIRRLSAGRGKTKKGSRPPSTASAARLRADLTLFSNAATEFTWFREAWRNHVAHGRVQYDENDAMKIMTHVHDFMERLSTRLKERRR